MPDRDYYFSTTPQMASFAPRTRRTSRRCSRSRASPTRRRGRRASSRSRRRSRRRTRTRVESEDVRERRHLDARRISRPRRPASTGRRSSTPPGLATRPRFIVWHSEGGDGTVRARRPSEPLDAWKDWLTFHTINEARELPAEGVRRRALRFLRQSAERHARTAPALAARRRFHERRARRSRRQGCMSIATFPPETKAKRAGDGRRPGEGVRRPHRRAHVDVARDQGQGQGQAADAARRRRLSRHMARLLVARDRQGRRARQSGARGRFSTITTISRSWHSRWTAASGG